MPTTAKTSILLVVLSASGATALAGEFTCAPAGVESPSAAIRADPEYAAVLAHWNARLPAAGEMEADCDDVPILDAPGYAGYPVRQCRYESNGASAKGWPLLAARVRLLEPSVSQLAGWTVTACRRGGATGAQIINCGKRVIAHVSASNGAQFPVMGGVVERVCDSDTDPADCPDDLGNSKWRPRITLFKNGVASAFVPTKWSFDPLPDTIYSRLFESRKDDLVDVYRVARLAGVERKDWILWRKSQALPIAPHILEKPGFDILGQDWSLVSREVHKAACASDENELFDALVLARKFAN